MTTYYARKKRNQAVVDQVFLLTYIVLVLVLTVSQSPNDDVYNNSVHSYSGDLSQNEAVSFTADQQYWKAHCSYGWKADSGCNNIASRVQVCHTSFVEIDSAYCTEYRTYVGRFYDRPLAEAY